MENPSTVAPDTLRLYDYLPQLVRANDAAGGYQFLQWLDGFIRMGSDESSLTYNYSYNGTTITKLDTPYTVNNNPVPSAAGIQALDDIIRDTPYAPGWSILLDVGRCPTYALPWLGQFVGVRFPQPASDAKMRQDIINECASRRGTRGHIQWVLDQIAVDPNAVNILERTAWDGENLSYDPYAVTIEFSLAGVLAYTYAQIFTDFSTYTAVESAFPNYGAMYGSIGNLETTAIDAMPAGLFVYFRIV